MGTKQASEVEVTIAIPEYLPGEREAIAHIQALGAQFGYGNLIMHLRDAWSETLQRDYKFSKDTADRAAGHICAWCQIDHRTGKKAKRSASPSEVRK